jgi:hypothetical protein
MAKLLKWNRISMFDKVLCGIAFADLLMILIVSGLNTFHIFGF